MDKELNSHGRAPPRRRPMKTLTLETFIDFRAVAVI
jgi:hypothetical protein